MTRFLLLSAATFIGLSAFSPAHAFDDAQKKEIETIIHDYIMENPSVLVKAFEKQQADEAAAQKAKAAEMIGKNWDQLTAEGLPSLGASAKDADVTVVEFFDYNCGYCKRALPDLIKLAEEDKKVRIVFQEMPILSEQSQVAALWALAAHKQGKYFDYHAALMNHRGAKNEKTLSKIAEDLGLDAKKMKKDATSDAVKKELMTSMSLAHSVGVQGTPAFIVQKEFFGGYIGHDGLVSAIKNARGK